MKKLGLFLPRTTPFYVTLFFSVKRAFETCGIQVMGWTEWLCGDELLEFCRQFQPDAIFEVNRTRNEIQELPARITHISWIMDNRGKNISEFMGSEIIYLFWSNWIKSLRPNASKVLDWLPPGYDPLLYYYQPSQYLSDISFVGHLSYPWTEEERQRTLYSGSSRVFTFGDIIENLNQLVLNSDLTGYNEDDFINLAFSNISGIIRSQVHLDPTIQYDLGCRAVLRMLFRHKLLELAVDATDSIRFYGPGGWKSWSNFKRFHHTTLTNHDDIRAVYQSSRINLHEGVGVHFRTLDCMASGGLLFFLDSPDDIHYGGIQTVFKPDVHYVSVNPQNFRTKASFYLAHKDECQTIINAARQVVERDHSWVQRIQRIIHDYENL